MDTAGNRQRGCRSPNPTSSLIWSPMLLKVLLMQGTFRQLEKAEICSSCHIPWEGPPKNHLHYFIIVVLRLSFLI